MVSGGKQLCTGCTKTGCKQAPWSNSHKDKAIETRGLIVEMGFHSTNPVKTNRYLARTKYKLFHISGMFLWSQLGVGRTLHQTLTLVMKDNVERKYFSLRNWFEPKLKSSDFLFLVSQLTYLYWSRRLACATRVGERKRSWPLFSPTFFFFFLSTLSAFHPFR